MPTSPPPRDPGTDDERPEDDIAPAVVVRRAVVMPSAPDRLPVDVPPPDVPGRTAPGAAAGVSAAAAEPLGSVQPATPDTPAVAGPGGGSGNSSGAGPRGRWSGGRSLPVLITAGVVVAIGATLPFAVTAWQHHDPAPAAQASGIPSAGLDGETPQTLPATLPTTATPTAKASPHASKKAAAHPHGSAGAPHPQTTGKSGGKSAPKGTVKPKATPKKTSAAPSARDRANAASSASKVLIENVTTRLCADVPGYGDGKSDGPVNQYDCNSTDGDNQLWDLQVAYKSGGPQGASLFVIRNHKDGLCMDLPNYGAEPAGTAIEEYPCNRTKADNQLWWLDPRPDGTYWIRDYSSGMCIDLAGVGTAREDARLVQDSCYDNPADDFRWRFK